MTAKKESQSTAQTLLLPARQSVLPAAPERAPRPQVSIQGNSLYKPNFKHPCTQVLPTANQAQTRK